MRGCYIHNISFDYTCPACNAAWEFCSRTWLIPFFNDGVNGKEPPESSDIQAYAAWDYGRSFYKSKGIK